MMTTSISRSQSAGGRGTPGRVVQDFISWIDFAPTFVEAAELDTHPQHSGRSFVDILASDQDGWSDVRRDHVFTGKERHDVGREGDLGYPVRCIRTGDYLYVRNYEPDRWPAGNPETGYTNVAKTVTSTCSSGNDRQKSCSICERTTPVCITSRTIRNTPR